MEGGSGGRRKRSIGFGRKEYKRNAQNLLLTQRKSGVHVDNDDLP